MALDRNVNVVCLLAVVFEIVVGSSKSFDLESCRVQLLCGSQPSGFPTLDPKGEACGCQDQLADLERRLTDLGRPRCPQTKYDFPSSGQTTNMIRLKTPVPLMTEMSLCTVITVRTSSSSPRSILSYATTAYDNAFLLEHSSTRIGIWINGVQKNINLALPAGTHLCVVAAPVHGWVKVYVNGDLASQVSYSGSAAISGGGALLLGQEQDGYMDRLDPNQSFDGTLENLAMWFRQLAPEEVTRLFNDRCSCPQGHSVAFTTNHIEVFGKIAILPVDQC